MSCLHQELAVLHDQERATDPAGVRHDPDLSVPDVPDHGDLGVDDVHLTSKFPEKKYFFYLINFNFKYSSNEQTKK